MDVMREILFKGKRTDNGEWIEGQLAYFFDKKDNPYIMPHCYFATREFNEEDENGQEIISDEIAFGGFISVVTETVGQFTGLTDKNGKKIFEGNFRITENGHKEQVFYSESQGAFCIDYSHLQDKDETYSELLSHDIRNFEVAGNIHDVKINNQDHMK